MPEPTLHLTDAGVPLWSEPLWRQAVRDGAVVPALTGAEAKVLLAYHCFARREDGQAWPGRSALVQATGLSEDGVRKAARGLRSKGVIEELRPGGRGPGQTSRVQLTVPPPQANADSPQGLAINDAIDAPDHPPDGPCKGVHPSQGGQTAHLRGDSRPGKGGHTSPQRVHEEQREKNAAAAQQARAAARDDAGLWSEPPEGEAAAAAVLTRAFRADSRQAKGLVRFHRLTLREVRTIQLNIAAMNRDARAKSVHNPWGFALAAIRDKGHRPITLDPRVHELRRTRQTMRRRRRQALQTTPDTGPVATAEERKAFAAEMKSAALAARARRAAT